MKAMDFFKATNGQAWYLSVDGGDSFEKCQREPFLFDRLASPLDEVALDDTGDTAELSLRREQLEQRGFTISKMTT